MSIQPKKFAHVVYRTRRFDEMLTWYTAVFDAEVQYANPVLAFLTYDDEHHRFAFANMAVIQPEETETDKLGIIGVDHLAYTYASLGDLFENYATLKEHGITPYWSIHHGIPESEFLTRATDLPVSPIRGAAMKEQLADASARLSTM